MSGLRDSTDRRQGRYSVGADPCVRPVVSPRGADTGVRPYRGCVWRMRNLIVALLLAGCGDSVAAPPDQAAAPKSVILLIGDGTGPQQFGLLMDWADAAGKSPTAFERLANAGTTGVLRTAPANEPLTDSAAGATALACGVSTV